MATKDPFQSDSPAKTKPKKVVRRRRTTRRQKAKVKQGSRVSLTFFAVGCGIFFFIFAALVFGGVAWVISDPSILTSTGMDIGTVKSLLLMFLFLVLGVISMGLLFSIFLSIYRLATSKTGKLKYVIWLILSFMFLVGGVIGGYAAYNEISKLTPQTDVTTSPVFAYVETKDGPIFAEDGIPLIAPFSMTYKLNKPIFDNQVRRSMNISPSETAISIALDCGNGQMLPMKSNLFFEGRCLFLEKKEYQMMMEVTSGVGNNTKKQSFDAGVFTPEAVIEIEPIGAEAGLNDAKDERILGTAPITARFKSQLLFSDLKLEDEQIAWDFDADGQVDKEDDTQFSYTFDDSKLHKIAYQLPSLGKWANTWFLFDVRVVESDLAACSLEEMEVTDGKRKVKPNFDEDVQIAEYKYVITDLITQTVVDRPKADARGQMTYTFPQGANYEVSMSYVTREKKKASCRPVEINVGYEGNKAEFTLYRQHEADTSFREVTTKTTEVVVEDNSIFVGLVPMTLQLQIDRIQPDLDAEIDVYYEGKRLSTTGDVYEFVINEVGNSELEFEIVTEDGAESNQMFDIQTSRNPVKAMINVVKGATGEDPLETILDASASPLYDEDDEIVYFTWDFGDGEILPKVSQGKVTHTYTFNTEKVDGDYYPSVTVETRKGFTDTYKLSEGIKVKRAQKNVEIRVDSHITQQANAGERVALSVLTDGLVDEIKRDFGNLKSDSCDGRQCSSTATVFDEPGTYTIKVEVSYKNNVPAVDDVKVRVF